MSAYRPVRLPRGVNHLARRSDGAWWAVCGRQLGGELVLEPRRLWARAWQLEPVCSRCEARRARARSDRDLDRFALLR